VTALTSGGRQPSSSEKKPVQVRIGIDELDKIDSVHDAGRFLNEIKVLFGIPHCFFLVSLSEDAMSQFERRGLPMRDVFDSSFDDVVRVGPLDASRSVALLRERTRSQRCTDHWSFGEARPARRLARVRFAP
jgi:hypothetical protein